MLNFVLLAVVVSMQPMATGFVSPFIVGWIKDTTGSTNNGLFVIAASLLVGGAIVLSLSRRALDR